MQFCIDIAVKGIHPCHDAPFCSPRTVHKLLVDYAIIDWFEQVLKDYDKSGMVNWPNSKGETPLFLACVKKNPEAVEILIHAGADPCLTNTSTLPIHAAVANGDIRYA